VQQKNLGLRAFSALVYRPDYREPPTIARAFAEMLVLYAKVASVSNKLMADYAICGRLSLLQVALEPLTYACRRACAAAGRVRAAGLRIGAGEHKAAEGLSAG
jgi:hypothetical protein